MEACANTAVADRRRAKVTVVQIGARHHYAVPRILAAAGRLENLFTDANAATGVGRWLDLAPAALRRGPLRRLGQRRPVGVPRQRIRQTDALFWRAVAQSLKVAPPRAGYVEDDHLFDRIVSRWLAEDSGEAGILYAMQKHGTRVLEAARARGMRTVVDIFITPLAHRIVEGERQRFPELERPGDSAPLELEEERMRREIEHADLLLCPGENVVEGLAAFPNASGKSHAVVPYGSGVSFGERRNEPVRGRVLFAGTADLRKGIHYLAMAAKELAGKGYDFRVAGNVSDGFRNHPMMRQLTFLGRVPRAEMIEEFLSADVFVLPTLAEGCASVVHEAVMAGCPVITTAAAGTMVRDGLGGLIVPERDPAALSAAISQVVENRSFRIELAGSCRILAQDLSEESWGRRLLAALDDPAPRRFG